MAPALPSISVSASNSGPPDDSEHIHHRVFIGPMPEKVVSKTEAHASKHRKRRLFRHSSTEDEDDISYVIEQNAFTFFLRQGGRAEDWGENEERSTREEMLQRWRDSEWGAIWAHRRKEQTRQTTNNWVGGSFEIGRFLGVNILQEADSMKDRTSSSVQRVSFSGSRSSFATGTDAAGSIVQETFITAPSHLDPSTYRSGHAEPRRSGSVDDSTPTSSTALLRPPFPGSGKPNGVKARTEIIPRPIIKAPSLNATSDTKIQLKGKGKLVHYADMPEQGESGPAPPSEVLERSGADVEDTSAGASIVPESGTQSPDSSLDWGDVVMRGTSSIFSISLNNH
jgi:hypothetical protein